MILMGAMLALVVSLQAASLGGNGGEGGGGGAGGGGRGGRSWHDDTILFRDEEPWNGKSYAFGYQTLFGNARREKAELKENALGVKYLDVEGEYSYPADDGSVRRVLYRANDQGYQQSDPIITKSVGDNPGSSNANADGTLERSMLQAKAGSPSNADRIYFPTEDSASDTSTTPRSGLTTILTPTGVPGTTNENTTDYYYDELGNRVGGIPPAVLGSLLG